MVFIRSTPYTNAVCCLINILSLKKNTNFKQKDEYDIWLKTAVLPMRTSSIYGLALISKQHSLTPKLIVENHEFDFPDYRFHRYKKSDVEMAKFSSEIYRKKCEEANINITVKKIDFEDLKKLVLENYCIVRINTKFIRNLKRNNSNYVVFKDYKNKEFEIIDPSQGTLKISEEVAYNSYLSLETKKHRAHKLLVFSKN